MLLFYSDCEGILYHIMGTLIQVPMNSNREARASTAAASAAKAEGTGIAAGGGLREEDVLRGALGKADVLLRQLLPGIHDLRASRAPGGLVVSSPLV